MKRPKQYFRAGAGAVIRNRDGRVLLLERRDIPGAWQFPQGGLDDGESPIETAYREVEEETGLGKSALRLRGRYPEPLVYELPTNDRSKKTGRGQVQYWFLFDLKPSAPVPRLPPDSEFRSFRWVPFPVAVARVVRFKKCVYRRLQAHFDRTDAGPARTK